MSGPFLWLSGSSLAGSEQNTKREPNEPLNLTMDKQIIRAGGKGSQHGRGEEE